MIAYDGNNRGRALRIAVGITMLVLLLAGGAGAMTLRDDQTGGDCTLIGTWDIATKICTLTIDLQSTAISIGSNNITLDGNEHTLTGNGLKNGDSGIQLNGDGMWGNIPRTGVVIKNFKIVNFTYGIIFWGATDGNIISGITLINNSIGIEFLYNNNNNQMINNNLSYNGNGIVFEGQSYPNTNNLIKGNNIYNNSGAGIDIVYGTAKDNIIINNVISSNFDGISIYLASNSTISNNVIKDNSWFGVILDQTPNNIVIDNIFDHNIIEGIRLQGYSGNNTILRNSFSNSSYGINNMGGHYSNIKNNNVSNNNYGIRVGTDSTFVDNIITNNNYGLYLYSASNILFYDNMLSNNVNFFSDGSIYINTWNISKKSGTNIIYGKYIAGNFWANPSGTGFSQKCTDADMDGICDTNYTLNSQNIDYLPLAAPDNKPPASITNLTNVTNTQTYINWTWTDPADIDFNHVEIYLDGIQKPNVLAGVRYYNATGLIASTTHEISTRTVDNSGNVNATWKNHTSTTAPIPDTSAPASVTGLTNITYAQTYINWTWTDPADIDFNHVEIYLDGIQKPNVLAGVRYYNATGLTASTIHEINTRTVDNSGNVNSTWKNYTATTASLPDNTAPASVTGLTNITYAQTYINWTWTDPADIDFNHVEIYLDGIQKPNVLAGVRYYNATGLTASTTHEISTRTVDNSGNVNSTWKNHTATTASLPDNTAPASVTGLTNITYAQTYINWTWADPADLDFDHVEVYLDGIQKPNVLAGVRYYNATGLTASITHEISTRTVDNSGNVNATWNNHTAITASLPDTTAPASVTDLHNISYAFNYINWTWTEPSDPDFAKVMVYMDGVYKNDVLKGVNYYNAIVAPGTYTIGTRTVDTDGNINATMVTHTATTILPPIRFINGTVVDSVSRAVISGATVSAGSLSTTTNEIGFYSLAVASGSYDLTATFDIRYYTNSSITVSTVGNAVVVQDIELVKKPMGTITGSVTRGT